MMTMMAVRTVAFVLTPLASRRVRNLGRLLGTLVHVLCPWRLAVIRHNLRCFGLPADERLLRACYEHLGRVLLLTLRPPHRLQDEVKLDNADHLAQLAADCAGGGVLVCSAHLGAWELVPAVLSPHLPARSRRHGAVVYRPLHDAALDYWLRRRRTTAAGGVELTPDAAGSIVELRGRLHAGGLVGLLPDQRRAARQASVRVRMLGHEQAPLAPGISALHAATGCPVWFVALTLCPEAHDDDSDDNDSDDAAAFRLTLTRLAERCQPGADGAAAREASGPQATSAAAPSSVPCALAQAYADALDAAVREAPTQYFWWHDRERVRLRKWPKEEKEQATWRMVVAGAVLVFVVAAWRHA